ncbi:hypothetical protein [Salinimicrobium oceani]|uniref:PH domain-containing protein n=1 Tax=Salinimicrobium oceani TaxID=2722702 RepID=A0ABX1CTQ5_9FLAO|nr:hypothetical protein [Salinimicrobium oceani]NJW51300.1 hypothetical protein [Salinimicrobium oceani]
MADFIVGSLYLLAGITGIIFGSGLFIKYGFVAVGLWYLGSAFYKLKFQYISIEGHSLTCFVPGRKKKIDLREVTRIKKFTDEITFLTPHTELTVSTKLINKKDFPAFKGFLCSLDLEYEKNPFTHGVQI